MFRIHLVVVKIERLHWLDWLRICWILLVPWGWTAWFKVLSMLLKWKLMKDPASILINVYVIFFKQATTVIPWHSVLRFRFRFKLLMLVDRGEIFLMWFFFNLLNHIVVLCRIIIVKSHFSFDRKILNSFKITISQGLFISLLYTWCLRWMRINMLKILSVCKRSSVFIVELALRIAGHLQWHLIFK